jgi:chloride channel protein, CIC family
VVEMTGDYTLTLPVMLAVAIATVVSRALSYGTIYTTKLLRRGIDIDHAPSVDPFEDLTAADAMRPFPLPLVAEPRPTEPQCGPDEDGASLPGPVTHQGAPQVLFTNEPLAQAVRQVVLYGRDGLPVLSTDGQHLKGWLTSANVLQAIAGYMGTLGAGDGSGTGQPAGRHRLVAQPEAPEPLAGYQVVEVTVSDGSAGAGQPLGQTTWPQGWVPVSVLDDHTLRDADPFMVLAPGDRVNLLVPAPPAQGQKVRPHEAGTEPGLARDEPVSPPDEQR